jgi:Tol biopolymer transport system component
MPETGMSLETPIYMSPEQAMGEREISPRSDVSSLVARNEYAPRFSPGGRWLVYVSDETGQPELYVRP